MKLRAELFFDEESHNWGFRVPSLRINGSSETREGAEQDIVECIYFALEPLDDDIVDEHEAIYFDVQVTPAKVQAPAR